MNVLIICGSARERANSKIICSLVQDMLEKHGVDTNYFNVGTHILPLLTVDSSQNSHQEVQRLRSYARSADGFFICTPDYHNGISGSLKNALDFLDASHFRDKICTMASVAGGGKGGINPLNNLRLVLRGVYAIVLSEQLVVDAAQVNPVDRTIDRMSYERLKVQIDQFVEITARLTKQKGVS